jgi:hypothetical protein
VDTRIGPMRRALRCQKGNQKPQKKDIQHNGQKKKTNYSSVELGRRSRNIICHLQKKILENPPRKQQWKNAMKKAINSF